MENQYPNHGRFLLAVILLSNMFRVFIIILFHLPSFLFSQETYHQDVVPIIKKHCLSCHSDGEIGPMPLTNYIEVSSYANMIKYVTSIKLMPPFKADHYKVNYKNKRAISNAEISVINNWISNGMQEGIPDTISYDPNNKEVIYDEIICMEESFEHYGIYYDQYQAFVLPVLNQEDKYVSHIEVIPGNKEIVRSANLSLAKKGRADKMDEWDPRYGFFAYGSIGFEAEIPNWYSWMPNTKGIELKNNEVSLIPKNSELILHLHYGPYGETQNDSTCVGIIYSSEQGKIQVQNVPFIATEFLADSFNLEAGLKKRFTSSFYIPEDSYIKSITPLAHLLCRSWEVFAVLPDQSTLPLLTIADWDFHWREKYVFNEYLFLPKGTRIVATARYDNTRENPYNPSDPSFLTKKGPHMFDENFLCYFELINSASSPFASIKKPFTVATRRLAELNFNCQKEAEYSVLVHNMTSNSSVVISEKNYAAGQHTIRSSALANTTGRYAISISSDEQLQDIWYFVIK